MFIKNCYVSLYFYATIVKLMKLAFINGYINQMTSIIYVFVIGVAICAFNILKNKVLIMKLIVFVYTVYQLRSLKACFTLQIQRKPTWYLILI